MNQLQLGDYRGGRDSITNLMGAEIPQLHNINAAAQNYANIGLQAMATRHAIDQKAGLDLRNRMALANRNLSDQMGIAQLNNEYKQQAQSAQEEQAQQMMSGSEGAMLDWAGNVIQQYEPNSPEYKQAERTIGMLRGRKHGSAAYNKGYLDYANEHDLGNMFNQAALGAAGWQQAQKPTPAATKKPLQKKGPSGFGDDNLHT